MGHAYTVFGSCAGQTDKVFGTYIGCKNSRTDDVPRFALSEKVILAVGPLHFLFVFFDGTVDSPYNRYDSDGENQPVSHINSLEFQFMSLFLFDDIVNDDYFSTVNLKIHSL